MAALTPYSYEHPRRCRPFQSPMAGSQRSVNNENVISDSPKSAYVEHVIVRIERSFQEKFDMLIARMEKCSDLSIASSRAVGVLSAQLDELRGDQDDRFKELVSSVAELRSSSTRMCAESQNVTMQALDEFCTEIMKSVDDNSTQLSELEKNAVTVQEMHEATEQRITSELALVRDDLASIPDQFTLAIDELVEEVNGRFDHQAGIVYDRIEERVDTFRCEFDEANLKHERYNEETFDTLISMIKEVDTSAEISYIKSQLLDPALLTKLCEDIVHIQTSLTVFSTESIPTIYQDVDTHSAQLELRLRQMVCQLIADLVPKHSSKRHN